MERVEGIEPSSVAWKAIILPLNYTRIRQGLMGNHPSVPYIVEPRSLLVLFLQQTGLGQPYNLSESHPVNPCRFYITIAIVGSHVSPKVPSPNINGVFCSAIIIKNHCLSTLSLRATYVKTHLNFDRNYYRHSYYLSSTELSLSVQRLQRASYILVFFLIDKSIILYFFTKNQVLFFQNSINCVRCNGIFI